MNLRLLVVSCILYLFVSHARADLIHQYTFDGDLSDNLGGPSLVSYGGTVSSGSYLFGNFEKGLMLPVLLGGVYTIDMSYHFDLIMGNDEVINFSGLDSRVGKLYAVHSKYNLYPIWTPEANLKAGVDSILTITRDASSTFTIYKDHQKIFSGKDQNAFADFANNYAYFFQGSFTHSGAVDYISIFNTALTAEEVKNLPVPASLPPTTEIPEPASLAIFGLGILIIGFIHNRINQLKARVH